ncbi:uncharacterized protein C9orf85 homolog isoform X2 [Poecile atricapillus]|uniref:uncharacterized protein C9orf85 homolog isoform X2 n=1 Tax=Poecile atricapillus TaxID=48891 RepID=UPI0027392A1A|nr:uncharacterized protein C9orf85 homolog isoform X2 [Poecile atricapillus]
MSSERGNVSRTRPQRHQNARAFKNDKYDTSARRKKINAKLHDGVCQHCKGILEWRVKFRKYKLLTKPKKCCRSPYPPVLSDTECSSNETLNSEKLTTGLWCTRDPV